MRKIRDSNPFCFSLVALVLTVVGLIGHSRSASAQVRCERVLMAGTHTSLVEMYLVESAENRSVQELVQKQKPFERLAYAAQKLRDAGVDIHVDVNDLVIVPVKNGNELNHLAYKLQENFGTVVGYDPNIASVAVFYPAANLINISHLAAYTAKPDTSFYHEVRHAVLTARKKAGRASWSEVDFSAWPFFADKKVRYYRKSMSFQEVETWAQDARYALKAFKYLYAPLQEAKLQETYDALYGIQVEMTQVLEVFGEARHRLEYILSRYDLGKGTMSMTESLFDGARIEGDFIQYQAITKKGYFGYLIPKAILKNPMSPTAEDKKAIGEYLRKTVLTEIDKKVAKVQAVKDNAVAINNEIFKHLLVQKRATRNQPSKSLEELRQSISEL